MSERNEAIGTARDLTGALGVMAEEVKRLRTYGRRNRLYVLVDILLTILLAGVGSLSVHAASQSSAAAAAAAQNRTAQIVTCESGNQARSDNQQLWTYFVTLATLKPPPSETAAQKAEREKLVALLRAKIGKTYMPRDCQALARGQKP